MPDVSSDSLASKDEMSASHLLAICRDGEQFYIHAADSVESYSIKSALQQMALARREMLQEVTTHLELQGYDCNQPSAESDNMNHWYHEAINQVWDFTDMTVLEKLRTLEADNLQLLIKRTRTASDKHTRELMANVAARFQLCLDLLDAIITKQQNRC
ncbi:hypothetical protein [Neptunicella sp. SCSIO 80796]|uniref:hypothetical protein n=1 Tax=Neptunicella plasticusilytica TaxID=3117012 RepID=UPI003A4E03C6